MGDGEAEDLFGVGAELLSMGFGEGCVLLQRADAACDDERRGVATVEVQAEAVGKAAPFAADVELLPLIAHRDEVAMPARLVVVRCPASLAVATSVEMS